MARTRRRHSYRKSKRWNPDAVPAAPAAKTNPRRRGRNPVATHTFFKRLSDGSQVRVTPYGKVTVLDTDGSIHDQWSLQPYEVPYLLKNLKSAVRANKYDYRADAVEEEYNTVRQNPRKRKGRSHRGHKRKHRGDSRSKRGMGSINKRTTRGAVRRLDSGYKGKLSSKSRVYRWRASTSGRKHRSNPAQFPAPFSSAMANPRRGKKRSSRGRARRTGRMIKEVTAARKAYARAHGFRTNPKRKLTHEQKRARALKNIRRSIRTRGGVGKQMRRLRKWEKVLVDKKRESFSHSPRFWRALKRGAKKRGDTSWFGLSIRHDRTRRNPKRKQSRQQKRKHAWDVVRRHMLSPAGKGKRLRRIRKWHRSLVHGRSEIRSPRSHRAGLRKHRR